MKRSVKEHPLGMNDKFKKRVSAQKTKGE